VLVPLFFELELALELELELELEELVVVSVVLSLLDVAVCAGLSAKNFVLAFAMVSAGHGRDETAVLVGSKTVTDISVFTFTTRTQCASSVRESLFISAAMTVVSPSEVRRVSARGSYSFTVRPMVLPSLENSSPLLPESPSA
jgi:hypothetical protein